MSIFDVQDVPVTIDGVNVIYIKPVMSYGDRQKLISASNHITVTSDTERQGTVDIGTWNILLLQTMITRWVGPDFGGRPCTATNIALIPENYPLLEKVLEELNERNKKDGETGEPSPNSSSGGLTTSKENPPDPSENTTSISLSQNGGNGHLTLLTDSPQSTSLSS